jgi:hypothetical protein
MATNIKHTLYNLEVPPPPGVWPHIESRLDAEFDAAETPAAKKMFDLSVTPPLGLWTDIAAQLDTQKADEVSVGKKMYDLFVTPPASVWKKIAAQLPQQYAKKEGRLISMHFRKAIAAAAAMVLLAIGAWYFLDNSHSADMASKTPELNPSSDVNSGSSAPAKIRAFDTEIGERPVEREKLGQKPLAALSDVETSIINRKFANRHGARRTAFYDYQPIATSYSGMDDVQVDFTENNNPVVEAPLIRDAKGQVILDKQLLSPDDCYITVTSPNGEQTRISSKFLHIISAINQDVEPQDEFDFMTRESSLWKIRFSEWKEKFLNQASFVPTATSFTDILELRDLLVAEDEGPK